MRLKLEELLADRRITQSQLADSIGVSRQAVSKWVGKGSIPDAPSLEALCLFLECEIGDLLEIDKTKAPPGGRTYRNFRSRSVA